MSTTRMMTPIRRALSTTNSGLVRPPADLRRELCLAVNPQGDHRFSGNDIGRWFPPLALQERDAKSEKYDELATRAERGELTAKPGTQRRGEDSRDNTPAAFEAVREELGEETEPPTPRGMRVWQ